MAMVGLPYSGFQVVPPCGGQQTFDGNTSEYFVVSSRAPVWGASLPGFCWLWYPQVSSRAPVWGASSPNGGRNEIPDVSSRAPVWGASCKRLTNELIHVVSSRAPVWGASDVHAASVPGQYVSSRAPVWGASSHACPELKSKDWFQVVPPCGGHRFWPFGSRILTFSFKSCPRVGGIL